MPEKAPVIAIPLELRFMCGAHLEREIIDTTVTVNPIITLTRVSEKELNIQAPTGVNNTPVTARGINPDNFRLDQEELRTIIFNARLETAITGTAHVAGANKQSNGKANKE